MKNEMNNFLGKNNTQQQDFELPDIPEVKEEATSTQVYNKKGKIYTQGVSFNKLSNIEKRNYRQSFLEELFKVVRGAEVRTNELISGINMLEQGGTREGVYRSIVLSSDYMSLISYEEAPSEKLIEFTVKYGEKFLGLTYDKTQISQLNLWGIKRVIVEKTLDVIDSFKKDGEDLYKWYAIFSRDFSLEHQIIWKSKTRKNSNLDFHYHWVKNVPLQHIKSEVIIKLHKAMNSL
jgi:hypothetical protein